MKKEKNNNKDKKKNKKTIDMIILIVLASLVVIMAIFTITREAGNQEIILMEIYKSAGPDTSTASMNHYYIYSNTNTIKIRSSSNGSNTTVAKEISQDSIDSFKNALDEYIGQNPYINTSFYTNERYTIEYNGATVIVPNPSVATALGYDSSPYSFYNTVESFINNIKN